MSDEAAGGAIGKVEMRQPSRLVMVAPTESYSLRRLVAGLVRVCRGKLVVPRFPRLLF